MNLFEPLDEDTFFIYAAKNYYNPTCIDADDFHEDIKRFKYIKRLLNRYESSGAISERLILNHLIVIFNVFSIPAGLKMLEYKIDDKHWPILKPYLVFLKAINNDQYTGIPQEQAVVQKLREI